MPEIAHKVNQLAVNNIEIINKSEDPRIFGFSSQISSLYFRNNGEVYQKFNTGNTDWELIFPKEVKNITADYTILRTNSNLTIDSTSGNIVLDLPDVSTLYKGKEFYFKKTVSANIVTINPFSGQTIDGNSSATLTDLNESLILIYVDTNNWTTKSSGISPSSNSSKLVNQVAHGFTLCQVLKFNGTTYELAQADIVENIGVWLITKIIDVNNFEIALSGYFDNLTGGTVDTTSYLSNITAGALTSTLPTVISQPIIYWITSTSGWILGYQANIISTEAIVNNEYVISNNGVLNFTSLSGIYKLIQKNNVTNEIDIKYSINNTYLDLVVKNSSTLFTDTQDTTSKVNIYVESLNVKIQNKTGSIKTFIIKKII